MASSSEGCEDSYSLKRMAQFDDRDLDRINFHEDSSHNSINKALIIESQSPSKKFAAGSFFPINNSSYVNTFVSTSTLPVNCNTVVIDCPEFDENISLSKETNYSENNQASSQNLDRLNNYIYQILSKSTGGLYLMKQYDFECDSNYRKKLVNNHVKEYFSPKRLAFFVIHYELEKSTNITLSAERLDWLAKEAHLLFPRYLKELFYAKATKNKCPTGSFYNLQVSIRERNNIYSIDSKETKQKKESVKSKLKVLEEPVDIIDDAYIKFWMTVELSVKLEYYKKTNIKEIFDFLPNLKKDRGHLLLCEDFNSANLVSSNILSTSWPDLSSKILQTAETRQHKRIKDILFEYSLKDKTGKPLRDESNQRVYENPEILSLLVLPLLFKKVNKLTARSQAKRNWSPDQNIVSKAFVYHAKEITSGSSVSECLQKVNQDLKNIHKEFLLPFDHPHIVITGPSLNHISSSHIFMKSISYECSFAFLTPLDAVDTLFKMCHVLGYQFPIINNHVYYFLQSEAYNISGVPTISAVTQLRQDMTSNNTD